jgi:hypothetical protein
MELAIRIVRSGFRPTFLVALWRGGAPIGITVQEVLEYHGIQTDHVAIRTSTRARIDERSDTLLRTGGRAPALPSRPAAVAPPRAPSSMPPCAVARPPLLPGAASSRESRSGWHRLQAARASSSPSWPQPGLCRLAPVARGDRAHDRLHRQNSMPWPRASMPIIRYCSATCASSRRCSPSHPPSLARGDLAASPGPPHPGRLTRAASPGPPLAASRCLMPCPRPWFCCSSAGRLPRAAADLDPRGRLHDGASTRGGLQIFHDLR